MQLNRTEELIEDLRAGRMVILMDDEDRENEGDLVLAASRVDPGQINFMARYARGLICLTLTREDCQRLGLSLMTQQNYSRHGTNFTISIDAARGVSTGISAADRALTIQTAVADDSTPGDLVQPGHVFPLMAQPGGVLSRAGHTEAGCDLCRLAGLKPAAVIVEILNEDGSMARLAQLEEFAARHQCKIGTIADLIRFRSANERTVVRVEEHALRTEYGMFQLIIYEDSVEKQLHFALVKGRIDPEQPVLVRVQLQNPFSELPGLGGADFGWPMADVLQRIGARETGVIVYLCGQLESSELLSQLRSSHPAGNGRREARARNSRDLRTIGLGAQILADVGVRRMRVLSAPKRIHGLSGFGLEVVEYIE